MHQQWLTKTSSTFATLSAAAVAAVVVVVIAHDNLLLPPDRDFLFFLRSMNRRLDKHLYLFIKTDEGKWGLPQAPHEPADEHMRNTAEKSLQSALGKALENLKVYFVGNAPIAHYRNEDDQNGTSTVFYHKAQVIHGSLPAAGGANLESSGVRDWAWLARDEVPKYVEDKQLADLMTRALVE